MYIWRWSDLAIFSLISNSNYFLRGWIIYFSLHKALSAIIDINIINILSNFSFTEKRLSNFFSFDYKRRIVICISDVSIDIAHLWLAHRINCFYRYYRNINVFFICIILIWDYQFLINSCWWNSILFMKMRYILMGLYINCWLFVCL